MAGDASPSSFAAASRTQSIISPRVDHALVDGELHAEAVEQRGEPPRGAVRVVAQELARLDALEDDLLDRVLPREVELLGDVAELAAAHRLTP